MKKMLVLFVMATILLGSTSAFALSIFNTSSGIVVTDSSSLKVSLVNQDPTEAAPGDYVNLLFKVENQGTNDAENVKLEIMPSFPFSLDPGTDAVQNLGTVSGLQRGNNAFLVKYKLKVDNDAVKGENIVKLKYSYGHDGYYYVQEFSIDISDPKTSFDTIVQDSSSTSITFAIANTGANTAYSVIIRIPQQENFKATGISSSIVGNLNAGDYTLATFELTPITGVANFSNGRKMPSSDSMPTGDAIAVPINIGKNITIEISYTDTLGIRRTIQEQVRYESSGTASITGMAIAQKTPTSSSNGLLYIGIGVAGIVAIIIFFKIRKKRASK